MTTKCVFKMKPVWTCSHSSDCLTLSSAQHVFMSSVFVHRVWAFKARRSLRNTQNHLMLFSSSCRAGRPSRWESECSVSAALRFIDDLVSLWHQQTEAVSLLSAGLWQVNPSVLSSGLCIIIQCVVPASYCAWTPLKTSSTWYQPLCTITTRPSDLQTFPPNHFVTSRDKIMQLSHRLARKQRHSAVTETVVWKT